MSEKKNFEYAVIIASDSRSSGEKIDLCLAAIEETMSDNYKLKTSKIVPDDLDKLQETMIEFADDLKTPLILVSGGTGFSARDITPEATLKVIEKETPGISEAIRLTSREKTPYWMLSRAVSGIRGQSLIINLPGSPKAVRESITAFLPALDHGLEILLGDFLQHGSEDFSKH